MHLVDKIRGAKVATALLKHAVCDAIVHPKITEEEWPEFCDMLVNKLLNSAGDE